MRIIRKIITLTVVSLTLVVSSINTSASTVSSSISGPNEISPGQSFSVTFAVNAGETIRGFTARILFDKSFLTIESVNKRINADFNTSTGAYTTSEVISGSRQFLTISFKPTSAFTAGTNTNIELVEFVAANDTATQRIQVSDKTHRVNAVAPRSTNNNLTSISVNNQPISNFNQNTTTYNLGSTDASSINVSVVKADAKASVRGDGNQSLSFGSNAIRIVVTAENGSTKTYTLNITRTDDRSSNNFLRNMTLSTGSLSFDKNRMDYTLIVDHEVTEMTISVEKEDAKATIRDSSITKRLDVYSNMFEFVVVAENNARRTYTVNVVRRDSSGYAGSLNTNNRLSSLSVMDNEIDFDPEQLQYELFVDHPVRVLDVNAQLQDNTATLIMPETFDLVLGENTFVITVIAQDETVREYTLKVHRAVNLPPLVIDQLIVRLDEIEAAILNLRLERHESLTTEHLEQLKSTNKSIAIHVFDETDMIIGTWNIKQSQIDLINSFNQHVTMLRRVPSSLASMLNYAQAIVLNFSHEGVFDEPLDFTLNLQGRFDASYLINVYYYDQQANKLVLKHEGLTILDDQITWEMDHASIYVISPASFTQSDFRLGFDNNVLLIGLIFITLSLLGNLLLLVRVRKLSNRLLLRQKTFKQDSREEIL